MAVRESLLIEFSYNLFENPGPGRAAAGRGYSPSDSELKLTVTESQKLLRPV